MARQETFGSVRVTTGRVGAVVSQLTEGGVMSLLRLGDNLQIAELGRAAAGFQLEHLLDNEDPLRPRWHREVAGIKLGARLDSEKNCFGVIALPDGSEVNLVPDQLLRMGEMLTTHCSLS